MEGGLVARESNLAFQGVPVAALRGRSPLTMLKNMGVLLAGVKAARALIAREKPQAILGTGGYVCVPLFVAARMAKIPTVLYLPDVVPGLAIRFLSKISTTIACNVEDSDKYIKRPLVDGNTVRSNTPIHLLDGKLVVMGYPVRHEFFELDKAQCRAAFGLSADLPTIVVYGGSRGARSINRAIEALLPDLLQIAQIIHVCGREGDEVWLREAAAKLPAELQARYHLYPYLFSGDAQSNEAQATPRMIEAFGAADIAVCRSGASTLGELPAVGLPAVLVPYPYVHQDENADFLVRQGAAVKVSDGDMLGNGEPKAGLLYQNLLHLIGDGHARVMMSERSKSLAQPASAERLADLLLALAKSKRPMS